MNSRVTLNIIFVHLLVIIFSAGCGGDAGVRKYDEEAPATAEPVAGTAESGKSYGKLAWTAPDGWAASESQSSMRLATYTLKEGDKEATCTIVPLQGDAGGLKANIGRWAAQIGITLQPGPELDRFSENQAIYKTESGFSATFVDFSSMKKAGDQSMLVAVIPLKQDTVFIKMTGVNDFLIKNRDDFISMVKSFKWEDENPHD